MTLVRLCSSPASLASRARSSSSIAAHPKSTIEVRIGATKDSSCSKKQALRSSVSSQARSFIRQLLDSSRGTGLDPYTQDQTHDQVRDERVTDVDPDEFARASLEDPAGHRRCHEKAEPSEETDDQPAPGPAREAHIGQPSVFEENRQNQRRDEAADEPAGDPLWRLLSHRLHVRLGLAQDGHPHLPEHGPRIPNSPDDKAQNCRYNHDDIEVGVEERDTDSSPDRGPCDRAYSFLSMRFSRRPETNIRPIAGPSNPTADRSSPGPCVAPARVAGQEPEQPPRSVL